MGARKECQIPGCSNLPVWSPATRKTEFCKRHGGGAWCQMIGCTKSAFRNPTTGKTEFCVAHGGGVCCQMIGCSKGAHKNPATGKTEFCRRHGGGYRCQWPGCSNAAKSNPATKKTEFCGKHGGGKCCQISGCSTSAVYNRATKKTEFCFRHGGGVRCQWHKCTKRALHNPATKKTEFCKAHGGSVRCQWPDCTRAAARDPDTKKTEFCIRHGGGKRCQWPGCPKSSTYNRETESGFCAEHLRRSRTDVHAGENEPPSAPNMLPTADPACLGCVRRLEPLGDDDGCLESPELYVPREIRRRLPDLASKAIEVFDVFEDTTLGARSLKPPSMLWDLGSMIMWLEVNEHQHATCDPRREWYRCNQIWEHFGCRPALIIEFNPDAYETAAGDIVDGMFREKRTSTGDRRLSPTAAADLRMSALVAALEEGAALATSEVGPTWRGLKQQFMFYTPATEMMFTYE